MKENNVIEFSVYKGVREMARYSGIPEYKLREGVKENRFEYITCGKRILINVKCCLNYYSNLYKNRTNQAPVGEVDSNVG